MRRLRWYLMLPALPVLVAVAAALLAPWVAPYSPTSGNLAARLRPPAWLAGGTVQRPLGTDLLGRDLLSRLIWGARISLLIALAATVLGAVVGSLIGLVTGYYRGRVDRVQLRHQRFHDVMEQARYTLDPKKRKELYTEATRIIHEEKPWLELFQEVVIYGVAKRLSFKPRPDYRLIVSEMTLGK
jgi:ABC-type transport system substrate-binding protein